MAAAPEKLFTWADKTHMPNRRCLCFGFKEGKDTLWMEIPKAMEGKGGEDDFRGTDFAPKLSQTVWF